MGRLRVLAAIPAYNEAPRIAGVLRGVLRHMAPRDVVVVDDGSTDGTGEVARALGVRVIRNPRNLGKGASLRRAFALAFREGYDGVITLDADGQHPPELIPRFLELARRDNLVVGSRKASWRGDMPLANYLSNRLTTVFVSLLAGLRLQDSQSGYRFVGREVLTRVPTRRRRFDMESELLVRAGRAGFRVVHVPIPVVYREAKSHIRGLRDTLRAIGLALRLLFER